MSIDSTTPDPVAELQAAAIKFAQTVDDFGGDVLEAAPRLEAAAIAFAKSRKPRAVRVTRMTPALEHWRDARDRATAQLGRKPHLVEIADIAGRSITAAHAAMRRLAAIEGSS